MPLTTLLVASGPVLSLNTIVPPALPAVTGLTPFVLTVAVKTTVWLFVDGFNDEVTVVMVAGFG